MIVAKVKRGKLKKKMHRFALSLLLPMIVVLFLGRLWNSIIDDPLSIYMLDVGQGDCILVKYEDSVILIDGGGDMDIKGENVGIKVVLPLLMDMGIMHIDTVFVTHLHFDHVKGILEIMNYVDIDRIILPSVYLDIEKEANELYGQLLKEAEREDIEIIYVSKGQMMTKDRLSFQILYPYKEQDYQENENHNSLVMKLIYGEFSMLFTGDIEEEDERILTGSGVNLRSDIIKVPHHGSNSSSTDSFLESVNPRTGLISYGKNTFGHPGDMVKLRYKNHEIPLYSTKNCGMIEVVVFDDHYEVKPYRGALTDETTKRTD